jgi:Tol biopolymer transport system component
MSLSAGTKLGPYEVIGPLGSGGMGEVYRARDTRLGRDVAVKVLPAERLSDPHRRARFVQEARAASALDHPNIVTIHEIESAEGIDFIVMELVPGETLAQRLRRGALPADEAVHLAIPVADAVAAAHAAGIVHRDLKPGNVMVRPDGVVKVLDFGLAKLVRGDTADSDDATATAPPDAPLSRPGAVAGTAGYMSPEQASGGNVDARSDIFSFGLVLYEMVTGRRAFAGSSSAEAMAAVLKDQPRPPGELALDLPKELERIILRCLRKDPGRRFQSMADVKIELLEVKEEADSQASASAPAGTATATRRARQRRWVLAAAGLLALAVATAATLWLRRPPPPPPTVVPLTSERKAFGGTFSPDGTQVAFGSAGEGGANWDIWLKIVGQAEARRLTTDPASEQYPAWSPDGTQIAFLRYPGIPGSQMVTFWDRAFVHLVSPLGGTARRLSDFPARLQLSWSPDGRWLAVAKARSGNEPAGGISFVSVATGEARAVTSPKPPAVDVYPAFSPDGRALAYASCDAAEYNPRCDVAVQALDSDLRPVGNPRLLALQRHWNLGIEWARDGRSIVYSANPGPHLWRIRADGTSSPERLEAAGRGATGPSVARGRARLVFSRRLWDPDIYVLRPGSPPKPLVESTFVDFAAQYSSDGRRIAFQSDRADDTGAVWLADSDGSNPTRLTRGPGREQGSPSWSPDGTSIAFSAEAENGRADVWTIGTDGTGLHQVTHDPADESGPRWSRDGRSLYFVSNRTGRNEIWRITVADGTEEPVSRGEGQDPCESPDGRTVYYVRPFDQVLVARPTAGGEARTVLSCVGGYVPEPRGILYLECPDPARSDGPLVLRRWDSATGRDQPVASVDGTTVGGLAISPDGRTILYEKSSWGTGELVMIENFR